MKGIQKGGGEEIKRDREEGGKEEEQRGGKGREERKEEGKCYLRKVQCLHFGQIFKVQGSCCIMLTFDNYAIAIYFDYISFSFS